MTEGQSPVPVAWEALRYGPWEGVVLPRQPPSEKVRKDRGLPRSVRPVEDDGVSQQPVFDPALAEYPRALRPSEPAFADPRLAERWFAARREALDTVLSAVAASRWAEHLVLRGSVLLRAWYGEQAREPGDLDFVVHPADWKLEDRRTDRLFRELAAGAERLSGTVRLHAGEAVSDEIWTYDRVPGRRLVLPWTAPGVPGGTVQLDFVFTERLPVPARRCELPGVTGQLLAATPELSLAWKLLWLVTDTHAQGKDLYDAVLLARTVEVSYDLLRDVFAQSDASLRLRSLLPRDLTRLDVDWEEFAKDYPRFAEPAEEYLAELVALLHPTFAEHGEYALRARWLGPLTEELRQVLARSGMGAVQEWLFRRYLLPDDALVVTNELLDGDLAAAHRTVAERFADGREARLPRLAEAAARYAAELADGPRAGDGGDGGS
ncbi:nucleotidyl transferase AbiEii/AbiGii toxin family protein [Kitasatospora sp. NPDC018619]|uniref:nucleotidyl transferase AbiEii/AbiGii toxin family protein n=1 Tax=unclassified Kitasatospora TaxID=2633591 RepID=UPI00378E03DC